MGNFEQLQAVNILILDYSATFLKSTLKVPSHEANVAEVQAGSAGIIHAEKRQNDGRNEKRNNGRNDDVHEAIAQNLREAALTFSIRRRAPELTPIDNIP